jgi:hypothetical protein
MGVAVSVAFFSLVLVMIGTGFVHNPVLSFSFSRNFNSLSLFPN